MIEVIDMTIDECRVKTWQHIQKVRKYIRFFTNRLTTRGEKHDASKLESPEIQLFAQHTDNLANIEYGSDEYKAELEALKPALDHHYAVNSHHPQHWPHGIEDMTLLDMVQMLCDWKASSERQKSGNLLKSIEINAQRFHIDNQLKQILINTAKKLDEINEI